MKILHQGDGHYHLGGDSHGHHGHDHHGHEHHDHGHKHNDHKHSHGPHSTELQTKALTSVQQDPEAGHKHDHHDHKHDHGHDHKHDHGHKHDKHDHCKDHKHEAEEKESKSIAVDAAYLHVLGDMIMSIGVIIASLIIWYNPEWKIADPICTYFFSIIVCFTVIPVLKQCILVLLEASPADIDTKGVIADIQAINGVEGIHDFHLWSISVGKYALSSHIHSNSPMQTLKVVTERMKTKWGIDHITIQMEDASSNNLHAFDCE